MTAITGINNSAQNARASTSATRTAAADDAALFRLAQQDANSTTQLSQSQYGTGSASTIQDASRLPPPPPLFTDSTGNGTASGTTGTDNTLSSLFGAVDANRNGGIDDDELATLQQMVETAMASMQPSSTGYSSSTVSLSDGTAAGTTSVTGQTVTQRYDLQQFAQQVLKQYDQVNAGASATSATGNTVSKVA